MQLTGQPAAPVYAYATDQFFSKIVDAQFTFERGDDGKVVGLTLHQNGQNLHADRLGADGEPLAAAEHVRLPQEQLDDYVGRYRLGPQAVLSITLDDAQLMAQLTGQPAFPIYAEKADRFFYRVVDAQIDFERDASGKVVALTLHQNGRGLEFARESQDKSQDK